MKRSLTICLLLALLCSVPRPAAAQVEEARFGWAGDVSGAHAVVAAPFRALDDTPHAGAVTFYALDETWEAGEEILSPTGSAGSLFGYAVALAGETAVIGAPGDLDGGLLAGAAYVYERRGGSWIPVQKLVPANARFGMKMGTAVEMGHGLLAVASPFGCGTDKKGGCVFLYEQVDGTWQLSGRLETPEGDTDAAFGAGIQIADAQTVIVSAPTGSGGVQRGGEVFVFRHDGSGWAVAQRLFLADAAMGDLYGEGLAYANGWLFVGAPGRHLSGHNGAVYAYRWADDAFGSETLIETPEPEDYLLFGQRLAATAGRLFIGAPRKDAEDTEDAGALYLFRYDDAGIAYTMALPDPDPDTDAGFGYLVAAEGDQLLIGAPFSTVDDLSGAGRAFFRDADVLTEVVEAPDLPTVFALHENYPNPFNPATTIQYALPRAVSVTITVYNVLGQRVAVLVDAEQAAGRHEVVFEARHLASGVYFYEMRAGDYRAAHRMTLLK